MIRTALVVVTYNGQGDIEHFLESLQKTHKQDYRILIVVDNGSSDDTVPTVRRRAPDAHIISNRENMGYAFAANQGIRYCFEKGFEYVFLANQDVLFEKDFLPSLVSAMESDPLIGAAQPLIMLDPERTLINSCGNALHPAGFGYTRGYRKTLAQYHCERKEVAYCSGAAVLLRVAVLRRVGLFDEDFFMYHEDTDLCWRMRIAGFRCIVDPSSIVYHHYEFSRSIKKFFYMERNRVLMLLKNYSSASLCIFAPLILVWEGGIFFYSCVHSAIGKGTLTRKEKTRAYRSFFSKQIWVSLWKKRVAIQRSRIVPESAIVSLFDPVIQFQDIDNPILRAIANPLTRCYFFFARQIVRLF
ncbi:glycosyltransferase family 2 protein [Candidatus Uhrbacteria bacterium]|nr:glycosyltransferase family 2 protein [Candidatus Uhrbacteria bacterium]